MNLSDITFAFLDTETTGLSPLQGARLCEVAIVLSKDGYHLEKFSSLINPGCIIPQEVINIHGITNEMVRTAPRFADIAPQILSLLQDAVLVCHNADFDVPFLQAEMLRVGLRLPQLTILDTLKLARKNGSFKRNRLGAIAEELGLSAEGWHRAMADALMTEQIFYHFINKFKAHGVETLCALQELEVKKLKAS